MFEEYIENVFIKFVEEKRNSLNLHQDTAILILDGCMTHNSGKVKEILGKKGIKMILIPPHSSQFFQMLDLITFGCLKKYKQSIKSPFVKGTQADIIYRFLKSFNLATIEENNRSAFVLAGFSFFFQCFRLKNPSFHWKREEKKTVFSSFRYNFF